MAAMPGAEISAAQWIEIREPALRHNLDLLRRVLSPGTRIAAVVKANAYGHGLEQVAPLLPGAADWLAVHSAEEARTIRGLGLSLPILIMGFVPPHELHGLDRDIHVMASTPEVVRWLGEYRERTSVSLPVHIKVDTGTKRQGVTIDRIADLVAIASDSGLQVVGVATHFANIEDTVEHDFARCQLEDFQRAVEVLKAAIGEEPPLVHASCSAAALLFRETDFSMVRVGISMYGHWPSRETQLSWILEHGRDSFGLSPVLSWRSVVGQLQSVAAGATVGYGRTWTALRSTLLAVIPVGYADGYPRALGNRARVVIRGQAAPVVGRVCMNIMMVDVTDVTDVGIGDEVVLIGTQGETTVTAEDLASLSETINYELLARISQSIPRKVVSV